jgi:hypothetical protein
VYVAKTVEEMEEIVLSIEQMRQLNDVSTKSTPLRSTATPMVPSPKVEIGSPTSRYSTSLPRGLSEKMKIPPPKVLKEGCLFVNETEGSDKVGPVAAWSVLTADSLTLFESPEKRKLLGKYSDLHSGVVLAEVIDNANDNTTMANGNGVDVKGRAGANANSKLGQRSGFVLHHGFRGTSVVVLYTRNVEDCRKWCEAIEAVPSFTGGWGEGGGVRVDSQTSCAAMEEYPPNEKETRSPASSSPHSPHTKDSAPLPSLPMHLPSLQSPPPAVGAAPTPTGSLTQLLENIVLRSKMQALETILTSSDSMLQKTHVSALQHVLQECQSALEAQMSFNAEREKKEQEMRSLVAKSCAMGRKELRQSLLSADLELDEGDQPKESSGASIMHPQATELPSDKDASMMDPVDDISRERGDQDQVVQIVSVSAARSSPEGHIHVATDLVSPKQEKLITADTNALSIETQQHQQPQQQLPPKDNQASAQAEAPKVDKEVAPAAAVVGVEEDVGVSEIIRRVPPPSLPLEEVSEEQQHQQELAREARIRDRVKAEKEIARKLAHAEGHRSSDLDFPSSLQQSRAVAIEEEAAAEAGDAGETDHLHDPDNVREMESEMHMDKGAGAGEGEVSLTEMPPPLVPGSEVKDRESLDASLLEEVEAANDAVVSEAAGREEDVEVIGEEWLDRPAVLVPLPMLGEGEEEGGADSSTPHSLVSLATPLPSPLLSPTPDPLWIDTNTDNTNTDNNHSEEALKEALKEDNAAVVAVSVEEGEEEENAPNALGGVEERHAVTTPPKAALPTPPTTPLTTGRVLHVFTPQSQQEVQPAVSTPVVVLAQHASGWATIAFCEERERGEEREGREGGNGKGEAAVESPIRVGFFPQAFLSQDDDRDSDDRKSDGALAAPANLQPLPALLAAQAASLTLDNVPPAPRRRPPQPPNSVPLPNTTTTTTTTDTTDPTDTTDANTTAMSDGGNGNVAVAAAAAMEAKARQGPSAEVTNIQNRRENIRDRLAAHRAAMAHMREKRQRGEGSSSESSLIPATPPSSTPLSSTQTAVSSQPDSWTVETEAEALQLSGQLTSGQISGQITTTATGTATAAATAAAVVGGTASSAMGTGMGEHGAETQEEGVGLEREGSAAELPPPPPPQSDIHVRGERSLSTPDDVSLVNTSVSSTTSIAQLKYMKETLMEGCVFMKYGLKGKDHRKLVCLSSDGAAIICKDPKSKKPSTTVIPLDAITAIRPGCTSEVFNRKKRKRPPVEAHCFSIFSESRTLDVEASSEQERDHWYELFRLLLQYHFENRPEEELRNDYDEIQQKYRSTF